MALQQQQPLQQHIRHRIRERIPHRHIEGLHHLGYRMEHGNQQVLVRQHNGRLLVHKALFTGYRLQFIVQRLALQHVGRGRNHLDALRTAEIVVHKSRTVVPVPRHIAPDKEPCLLILRTVEIVVVIPVEPPLSRLLQVAEEPFFTLVEGIEPHKAKGLPRKTFVLLRCPVVQAVGHIPIYHPPVTNAQLP